MITLDENDVQQQTNDNLSFEEDVLNKVNSLNESLANGEIPQDLKDFVNSLQNDSASTTDEEIVDDADDFVNDSYETEVDLSYADPDEEDTLLDNDAVSVEELDSLF